MELPKVRRHRTPTRDVLYVEDAFGVAYGWADIATGDIHVQIPGSRERIEAAVEAWALSYPEDDLAQHAPGRNLANLVAAWDAEIAALKLERAAIDEALREAEFKRTQYSKGRAGEGQVGTELNTLHAKGWGILHSIPVFDGRSDIDHLLIGPAGVWTVNSKAHVGLPIRVNGDRVVVGRSGVDYVPAARHEAQLATKTLRRAGFQLEAHAAIAFLRANGTSLHIVEAPQGVFVGYTADVMSHLLKTPRVLADVDVARIFHALRQRVAWDPYGTHG